MHSGGNAAIKGRSWPNFWANLASFSLGFRGAGGRGRCRSRCRRVRGWLRGWRAVAEVCHERHESVRDGRHVHRRERRRVHVMLFF